MKAILLILAVAVPPLAAQVVSPTTGKKFETRTVNGGGGNNGVAINTTNPQPPPTKVTLTSYFILSDTRQWKSSDGRSLVGSIIAFEDAVVQMEAANAAAAKEAAEKATPAKLPDKPTLIREGKVRLLVDRKPYEVPLDRLSDEDRKFVEELNARLPK